MQRLAVATDDERETAIEAAALAIRRGELIVLPTDTVYGIAADAFSPDAVQALLDAKGRGREMPPPVLISSATTLDALTVGVPDYARTLIAEFWPGALTIVCRQQTSLQWDLGETRGTVAVRMPDDEIALAVLERTGPLAVSSANRSGRGAARTADEAESMLGEQVEVIVDAGAIEVASAPGEEASTIVDCTGPAARILRRGAISLDRLNAVLEPIGVALADED